MSHQPLRDQVAVVTGATRGTGRGIARMLGAAGATVYCTGRSVKGHPATAGRPEMIEETAEMVTAEGGHGITVRTDHTVEAEVARLFALIRSERNRLDILVNDVWGGDELTEWDRHSGNSIPPCFLGRGVAALAADPNVAGKSGGLYSSGSLAREYGFTDLDGRRPDWMRYWPSRVQEIFDREETPDEISLFYVRSRLRQIELDPAAKEEIRRLGDYLGPI